MLIYIVCFIFFMVVAVEYDLQPFKSNTIFIIIIILLSLFAGFRGPEVAKDYGNYQSMFDHIYDLTEFNNALFLPLLEPGFAGIVLAFRSIFYDNYGLAIMLFYSFSSVLLKAVSIKNLSVNPYLAILFYYSHYFMLHEMTQIRIGFASAIFLVSLIFYLRGFKKVFVLMTLMATFFHYSAIMYLLLLLFDSRYFNKYVYAFILGISLLLGYLKIPVLNFLGNFDVGIISGKVSQYAGLVESGRATNINVFNVLNLLNIVICLYFIFFIPKQKLLEDKPILLFLKCNILAIFLLSLLSGFPSLAFRISELFGLASIFVYASLINYLPFYKLNILVTVLIAAIVFYITVYHVDLLNPYYIIHVK